MGKENGVNRDILEEGEENRHVFTWFWLHCTALWRGWACLTLV